MFERHEEELGFIMTEKLELKSRVVSKMTYFVLSGN